MLKKNIGVLSLVSFILLIFTIPLYAEEEFQPVVSFHGDVTVNCDSYFGWLPDDPVDLDDLEDTDLRKFFALTQPTTPGIAQSVNLEFYANPVPDLEMSLKLSHTGKWGGEGTRESLTYPLVLNETYVRYYSDWAMFTIGKFNLELDSFGILLGGQTAREGVSVHTMFKDTWITFVWNRLLMTMYRDYPYTSTFLLDDLSAMRISRRFGNQLVGLNMLFDGFYDEKGVSIDLNGPVFGRTAKAELSLVYPAVGYREDNNLGCKVWPAILVAYNAIENEDHILTVRAGAFDKGYVPQFGKKSERTMESSVKLYPNTYGIDVLYQRGLAVDTVLGANLVVMDFVDKQFQKQLNIRIPNKTAEVKVTKFLSEATDVSLSVAYNQEAQYNYGKAMLEWAFRY